MKYTLAIVLILLTIVFAPSVLANESVTDLSITAEVNQTSVLQFDEFMFIINVTNLNTTSTASNFTINVTFPYNNVTLSTIDPSLQSSQRVLNAIDGDVLWDAQNISSNDTNRYELILDTVDAGNHVLTYELRNATNALLQSGTVIINIIDSINPSVTINDPMNTTSNSVDFEIDVNEISSAVYSLDNGVTNNTMLTSDNISFFADGSFLTDGYYEVFYYVTDLAGNQNTTESVVFTVDTIPPEVNIVEPQNITYTTSTIPFAVQLSEIGDDVIAEEGSFDFQLTTTNNIEYSSSTVLADGFHTFTYEAWDIAGNSNDTESISFSIDTTAPVVTFSEPSSNEYFNVTTVDITISLDGPGFANISIDGGSTIFEMDTTNNITFNYTYVGLAEGTYTIEIYGADVFGNVNTTTRSFTVDTTKPTFTIDRPLNTTIGADPVTYQVTVDEPASQVTVSIDNGVTTESLTTSDNLVFSFVDNAPVGGYFTAEFTVTDLAGNTNTSNVTFTIDTFAPLVTVINPQARNYNFTTQDFIISLSEEGSAEFSIDNGVTNYTMQTTDNQNFNYTLSGLVSGTYTAEFYTQDIFGNENNTQTLTFTIDQTAPIITITNPSQNDIITIESVTFQASSNEDMDSMWFTLDGGATNYTMTTANNRDFSYTNSSVADNIYNLIVYGNDTAGNSNRSNIGFLLDTMPPQITINQPQHGLWYNNGLFSVTLSEIGHAWISIDGGAIIDMTTVDNLTFTYQDNSLPDGLHTVDFFANDSVNNVNDTESSTFTIDTDAPTLEVLAPVNDMFYNESNFSMLATLNQPGEVWFTFDNGRTNYSMNTIDSFNFSYLAGNILPDGTYTITFYGSDNASNVVLLDVNITRDSFGPEFSISNPSAGDYGQSNVELRADFTEDLKSVYYTVNGGPSISMAASNASQYVSTIENLNDDSTYIFRVFATDIQGRTTNRTRTITTDFRPDLFVSEPDPDEVITNDFVRITITSSESVNASYNFNGTGFEYCFNTSVSGSCEINNLTNSTLNTLNITVVDSAGNVNSTAFNFSVAIEPEVVTPPPTSSGSSGGGGGGGGSSIRPIVVSQINDTDDVNDTEEANETQNVPVAELTYIDEIEFIVEEDELLELVFTSEDVDNLSVVIVIKDTLFLGDFITTVEAELTTVDSYVQTIFFSTTESSLVDVDNDGVYDIEFSVVTLDNTLIVTAKRVNQAVEIEIEAEETVVEETTQNIRNFITTQVTGFSAGETGQIITGVLAVAGGLIIIVLFSQVFIRARKPKN